MNNKILMAVMAFLALSACKKYDKCDNAQVCVKNVGQDTISYGWNSSFYDKEIAPGASACENVGEIDTDPNNGNTITTTFNSDHGSYAITVDECNEQREID